MAQQELGGGGTGDPETTEEVQAQTSEAAQTETPALNRAERRAQAKGKKSGGTGPSVLPPSSAGPSARPTGHAAPVRIARTGSRSK